MLVINGIWLHMRENVTSVCTSGFRLPSTNAVIVGPSLWFAVLTCLWCLLGLKTAYARDLSTIDFSLRLPAALSKFSPYSDVAGVGGASAGSQYQTSQNPAATDWQPATPYSLGLSPQYQAIVFGRGPTVHVPAQSLTIKTPASGSIQLSAAEVISVGSSAGALTLLNGEYGQFQWGYKLPDRLAMGLNVNYTSLNTRAGMGGITFANSDSHSVDVRGGILGGVADGLLMGLVIDYGVSPAKTMLLDPTCPCSFDTKDTTRQLIARGGATYEYAEKSSIYLDYQHGRFWNSTGTYNVDRIFSGVEHQIFPWLYARAGFAYDVGVGLSPTAGLGFYPTLNSSIDIGFQNSMFRELSPEYGSSKLFGISVSVSF